eukprot:901347-Rhodomonas_salina.4
MPSQPQKHAPSAHSLLVQGTCSMIDACQLRLARSESLSAEADLVVEKKVSQLTIAAANLKGCEESLLRKRAALDEARQVLAAARKPSRVLTLGVDECRARVLAALASIEKAEGTLDKARGCAAAAQMKAQHRADRVHSRRQVLEDASEFWFRLGEM